jgi:hypothetical protein
MGDGVEVEFRWKRSRLDTPPQHTLNGRGRERPILASASTSPFPRLVNHPRLLPSPLRSVSLLTPCCSTLCSSSPRWRSVSIAASPKADSPAVTGRAVCGSGCGLPGQGTQCVNDVCKCTASGQDACGNSDFYYCPDFQTNQYSCGSCTNSVSTLTPLPAANHSAILTQSASWDSAQSAPRARIPVLTGRSTRAST